MKILCVAIIFYYKYLKYVASHKNKPNEDAIL